VEVEEEGAEEGRRAEKSALANRQKALRGERGNQTLKALFGRGVLPLVSLRGRRRRSGALIALTLPSQGGGEGGKVSRGEEKKPEKKPLAKTLSSRRSGKRTRFWPFLLLPNPRGEIGSGRGGRGGGGNPHWGNARARLEALI